MNEDQNRAVTRATQPNPEQPDTEIFASASADHASRDDSRVPEDDQGPRVNFTSGDTWLFIELLRQRWRWIAFSLVVCGALGLVAGMRLWPPSYKATAQLIRNESPRTAEVFAYQTLTPQSYANLLRSPELMSSVAAQTSPPIPVDKLTKRLKTAALRDGDVIQVEAGAFTKEGAVDLANLYTTEAVRFTRQLQWRAAEEVLQFVGPQIATIRADMDELKNKERPLPKAMPVARSLRPSVSELKLQTAREELVDALTRYTDSHPVVQAAQAKVDALQAQLTNGTPVAVLPSEAELVGQFSLQRDAWEMLRSELQPLEYTLRELTKRESAAKLVAAEPPGYYRVLAPATMRDVKGSKWAIKIGLTTFMAGMIGLVTSALLVLLVELAGTRLKASADVRRVTGLPVLATAPNLDGFTAEEERNWAFRTWTALQGRFSPSPNHGLICGITSAARSEGRSTWVKLLARAASESGFRVVKITAGNYGRNEQNGKSRPAPANGHNHHNQNIPANVMTSLPSPSEVEHKLVGPESQRVVQIPLPGWAWNLERRKQWQSALREWSRLENVVILIELPPASVPETVLLAHELPNLIWLTDSGASKAEETRAQIETLRNARCNLVGAVLNRARPEKMRRRLARWVSCGALLLSPALVSAQTPVTNGVSPARPPAPQPLISTAANTNLATNAPVVTTAQARRAAWQQRFTLGAGDVLRISLYGAPELTRNEAVIAPDGRIGFLEAQDIMAAGRTIDELRLALDQELSNSRRAPRTMISPVTLRSKKYAVLGKVVQRGVYHMDHPTTILEAVALAKGFEMGLRERDSIDLVDLHRSFLMRGGKRVPVNFEKMFVDGDLAQNIYLEPGDFLFFPPGGIREIHVVGDVRYPGSVAYTPEVSLMAAIAQRAGFNEKAYQSRVLVVRGSLEKPETFVVDTKAILAGQQKDFRLEPRDIVYVAKRPWWRAEDMLDLAITAFLQSIVTAVVEEHVIAPFNP